MQIWDNMAGRRSSKGKAQAGMSYHVLRMARRQTGLEGREYERE